MTIRVVLADDQALLRGTFRLLLEATDGIDVVAEAGDGQVCLQQVRATGPDVVLMDLRMPVLDGIEATRRITTDPDLAATRILVLTTYETEELVAAALRAGASGFLGKDVSPADLVEAIRTVAAGERLLSPQATTALIRRFLAQPEPAQPVDSPELRALTEREREIVALVGQGLSNDDIAARLVISPATAKTHVNRAMAKTGARDRAQLVVLAHRHGLVPPH